MHRYWVFIPPRRRPTNFCFDVIPTGMAQDRQNFSSPEQLPQRSALLAIGDVHYGHGRVSAATATDATSGAAPAGAVCSVHRSPSQ